MTPFFEVFSMTKDFEKPWLELHELIEGENVSEIMAFLDAMSPTETALTISRLNSVDQAEVFRGAEILIKKGSLSKKDEDEFFWYELVGLDVYLTTGQYLGVLKEIFPTGSNDVYVVENQGREFLIPAMHQIVKEINIPQKRMVISPVAGLLDL